MHQTINTEHAAENKEFFKKVKYFIEKIKTYSSSQLCTFRSIKL